MPATTLLKPFFSLVIASLLAACSSGPPKPDVDYKADYDFMSVNKVAFFKNSGQVSGDNPLQLSDIQRNRVDEAVRYALELKGMQFVDDASQADMLISWHLMTQDKTDVRTYQVPDYHAGYGGYYGYNRYSRYNCWSCTPYRTEVSVQNYTQGTFIVDMIAPELRQSVWRGVTQSKLKGGNEEQANYNEAAVVMFESFPPLSTAP
ncbi:MAG: DUF4136 domain-containing protein [Pseudomonadota bacterium]